jgi:hypothetical protein
MEMKHLFFIAPEAKVWCVSHWKTVIERWTGHGPGWTCASGQLKSRAKAQRA